MRQTKKLIAARRAMMQLGRGDEDHIGIYVKLENAGYQWKDGQWQQRPGIVADFVKGVADIRVRAGNGELVAVIERLQAALNDAGLQVMEVSRPYPDDRHGPATTSRVYIQVKV